jgi:uncharacterized protein DUF1761
MAFAGINYLAIFAAAVAAWIFGAVYYTTLSKPWLAAVGMTAADMKKQSEDKVRAIAPFILSFVAEIVMAWVLAGVLGHLGPGQVTVRNGVISALFLWFGFVLTTIATNNAYPGRKVMLTVIDAGHWLGVMLLIGAIVGGFGAR